MSRVLDHSGQTMVLAFGIREFTPPLMFAFMSNGIGIFGAFMTSSNTASNVLFSQLQSTIADLEGLPQSTLIAAQSAGGAIGNAIAPANAVLGTNPICVAVPGGRGPRRRRVSMEGRARRPSRRSRFRARPAPLRDGDLA